MECIIGLIGISWKYHGTYKVVPPSEISQLVLNGAQRHRLQQLPHGEDVAVDHGLFQLVEVRRQRVTEVVPRVALGELPFLERNGEDII